MRSVPIALLMGVLASPVLAYAAPSAADRALAESLFQEARALIAAGDVAGACPKLTESFRLDPQVGALLYAATCHEQEGKVATAWIEFTEAIEVPALADEKMRSPPPPSPVVERTSPPSPPRSTSTTGWILGGAGGLSIGFGLYMGGLMFQRVDHAEAGCAGRYCTQEALDMFDEARAQRAIAVAALGSAWRSSRARRT